MNLRKSTAGQVIYFTAIDSSDFKTPKTGLSIANTDIKLIFNDGTTQTNKNSGGATEIGSTGTYYFTLDATDTATLGKLRIDVQKSGMLPWFTDRLILNTALWDAFHASSGGAIPNLAAGAPNGLGINGANTGTVSFSGPVTYSNSLNITNGGFNINNLGGPGLYISGTTNDIVCAGTGLFSFTLATISATSVGAAVWQDTTAGHFTVGNSIGKSLYTTAVPGASGGHFIAGSNASTSIAILSITNGLSITSTEGDALTITSTDGDGVKITGSQNGMNISGLGGAGFLVSGTTNDIALVGTGTMNGTIATVTNLTNAPTNGDFTATMKTYLGTVLPFAFTGARSVTITVNDGATAIASALVRVTQGSSSQLKQTNASGVVTFSLDDGSYTISITKGAAYSYTPDTITVSSGATSFTKSMTHVSIPTPSTGQCTGTLAVVDTYGAPESGVTVYFEAWGTGESEGSAFTSAPIASTSNGSGIITRLFPSGGINYRYRRGTTGNWVYFTTASADGASFTIPSNVGKP